MKHTLKMCCISVLILAVLTASVPAFCTEEGKPNQSPLIVAQASSDLAPYIDRLELNTKSMLLKLIDLERYILNYRMTVAKQGRWKGWRYALSQEANNAISGSGSIVGTYERMGNIRTPRKLNRVVLENGNVLGLIGQTIGASGSAVELCINGYHEYETHKKGFSPRAAKKRVLELNKSIESLLKEREQIIASMNTNCGPSKYADMARAEEPVMRDMRDISLSEFEEFHSHLRRQYAFQQSLYMTDIARNTVGAVGNRYGWLALRTGDRNNNTNAGVLFAVSGGLTLLNPYVSRLIGKVVGDYHERSVRAVMLGANPGNVEKLNQDLAALTKVANSPDLERSDLPLIRTALYSQHEQGVQKQLHLSASEERAGVRVAAENMFSGTLIGGSKITSGVLFTVAGERFRHNGKQTNILLGSSNVLSTATCAYAFLDTLRIQIKRERDLHRRRKEGTTPGQIVKERLANLDAMEKQLNSGPTRITAPTSFDFKGNEDSPIVGATDASPLTIND